MREIIKGTYRISSGGVTMKNISRWTGKGGSYRNVHRLFPHEHKDPKKPGRPRKYGKKIDYQNIDKKYLVNTVKEDGMLTQYYQISGLWTKKMTCLINVVIIVKTDLNTQKSGRVVLFSTDLNWRY